MRIVRWVLGVLVGLLLAVTAASLIYNAVTSDPNVPVTELWHGKVTDGTAYREWGSHGPAVIMVGGFLEPSFVWEKVGRQLGRAFHVYALDLDGFGYTKREGPWTLAHWGDQVQAFERAHGIDHAIFVGHSLGAAVAVEMARRGDALGVVLVDGDALKGGGPPRLVRVALAKSPFFTSAFRLVARSNWIVRKILRNAYGVNHPKLDAAELRRWTDPLRAEGSRHALQAMLESGIPGFTRDQLRAVRIPALVLWGASDTVDPISAGRDTAADLHARFIEVHGAGHLSMLQAATELSLEIAKSALTSR